MVAGSRNRFDFEWVRFLGAQIVAAGITVGAGGAWTLSQVLSSLLFEVDPTDSRTLAATSVAVALAAAAACYFPARRASRIDPVTALRCFT